MLGRSSLGALLARTPFVTKLTADPAYERARRWGLSAAARSRSSRTGRGLADPAATRWRATADLRRAAHVVTPSAYLRELALGWGVRPGRVDAASRTPRRRSPSSRSREQLRARARFRGPDARLRRPADGAEVARRRDRGRPPGRRRARDRGRRARPARRSSGSATAASSARCRGGRCSSSSAAARRVAALLGLGELPAHGRRGARGGNARDRDPHRRGGRGARRTASTGSSSSPATRRRSPRRSRASSPSRALAALAARERGRARSPTTPPSTCTAGSSRSSSGAAGRSRPDAPPR